MDTKDIAYLLQRARFHRRMAQTTQCNEARWTHHQFVKNYQHHLLEIRRARSPVVQVVRELVSA